MGNLGSIGQDSARGSVDANRVGGVVGRRSDLGVAGRPSVRRVQDESVVLLRFGFPWSL